MTKDLDALLLATEDVGSFPLQDDFDEGRKNVDQAIKDKVEIGLDYPCYPQLPGIRSKPMNMGLQFLLPLSRLYPAIQIIDQQAHLSSDKIDETPVPVGVERAEYYLTFLRKHGLAQRLHGVKACVTGPFTLASYLDSSSMMTCGASKAGVVKSLASILSKSCKRLSDLGFDIINIDEPFLSLMLGGGEHPILYGYEEQFIIDTLDTLIKEIAGLSAVHVCGTITPMAKKVLLASRADILDHEFSGNPRNLHAYNRNELELAGKFLAYGCVSSVNRRVETVEEITKSLQSALEFYGPRIIVKPDCGFGGLEGLSDAYVTVLAKLRNMVRASRDLAAKNL
jgi:methionine synthase II (cobalamin-independent)